MRLDLDKIESLSTMAFVLTCLFAIVLGGYVHYKNDVEVVNQSDTLECSTDSTMEQFIFFNTNYYDTCVVK